jgi:ABC-type nickel/cobalt efflux system permease component RcnA
LALGVSGGLLPCPSALVVLLAAISLHRVAYGLALVTLFSLGLATVLTSIGLAFVFAKRFLKPTSRTGFIQQALPAVSAFVITGAGVAICYEALTQAGIHVFSRIAEFFVALSSHIPLIGSGDVHILATAGAWGVLGLGLVFGLKHATEVDHVVAVTTIVSEQRSLFRAALVGGLWGLGHTASLIVVGAFVLALRIAIPEQIADWMEFGIAIMIIILGASAILRTIGNRPDIHVHRHRHDDRSHTHVHFHEAASEDISARADQHPHQHHVLKQIGLKPLLVGCMHGLAGSAALTLLVLTQINSVVIGMLYLLVFGAGSIIGMLIMSGIVGLPFTFKSRRLAGLDYGLRMLAGILSVTFGIWYALETAAKAAASG